MRMFLTVPSEPEIRDSVWSSLERRWFVYASVSGGFSIWTDLPGIYPEPSTLINQMDLSPLARFIDEASGPLCFRAPKTNENLLARIYTTAVPKAAALLYDMVGRDYDFPRKSPFSKNMDQTVIVSREAVTEQWARNTTLKPGDTVMIISGLPGRDGSYVMVAPSEPSPLDKALEDFVARRKAKRDGRVNQAPDDGKAWAKHVADRNNAEALDRAMSRFAPHDTEIHERLMPYRGRP